MIGSVGSGPLSEKEVGGACKGHHGQNQRSSSKIKVIGQGIRSRYLYLYKGNQGNDNMSTLRVYPNYI